MAIARKGSRKIVVGSIAYQWVIRRRPTYVQGLAQRNISFAVQLEEGGNSTLLVALGVARLDNRVMAEARVISPSVVAFAIEQALQQGWRPDEAGSAFKLSM